MHPYQTAPAIAFWSRAVSKGFDPRQACSRDGPMVRATDLLASVGSCFAANLVPYLGRAGLRYWRVEPPHPALADTPAENPGYANFSAAYGNVYTARQLLELLRRALGYLRPAEDRWYCDGSVIDPYRPGLRYPASGDAEFDLLTAQHLRAVREVFLQAAVFIFTLGLTEAWVSAVDGAVFPACPGTVAGRFDERRHRFVNFSVAEVAADLDAFVAELRRVNPTVRLIFTASAAPLVATATDGHVLAATVYSRSVLWVAAEEICQRHIDVSYFPAHEIVSGPQAPEAFYAAHRRNVTSARCADRHGRLLSRLRDRSISRCGSGAYPSGVGRSSDVAVADHCRH
ncbi:GSCFA domain-containing protein [Sinimarinibacterium thermocellulolyticum]|uniref:GSCFA domain-containing protein n=1 Tax=Sinimarinibacterium thermocellulolyticum TaxID=3170016 RepID=A0ABV2AEM6_9GAMM